MTDERFDEQVDPEKAARREEDAPDVEGHRLAAYEPEKASRLNEDDDAGGEEGMKTR